LNPDFSLGRSESTQKSDIATKLVARCVELAQANPMIDQLILTVTATNAHVVRLYERVGFISYGLLPRAICVQGQFFDKMYMRLDLQEARAHLI
jgi:ribosomal protein S18 acetylase RimI-like enzyme